MTSVNCVFVVDDDPSARIGLARLIRTAGYDVCDFASTNEFVDALGSESPSCMVLDARMLELSGEELKACRGVHPPIIVVTTVDDSKTRQKALKMNAAGFFRKPVDGAALLDAINWALRSNISPEQGMIASEKVELILTKG